MSAGPRVGTAAALGVCLGTQVTKTAPERFSDRKGSEKGRLLWGFKGREQEEG